MVQASIVRRRVASSLFHKGRVLWRTVVSASVKSEGLFVTVEPAPRLADPKGLPLLLVQGWACGSSDWGAVPKMLASAGNRSVVTYDSRGIGGSPALPHSHRANTVAALAHETIEAADAVGLSQAHVLGVSLGGMVVQELAALLLEQSPQLGNLSLRSLVLCSTSPGGKSARGPPPGFFDIFALGSRSSGSSSSSSDSNDAGDRQTARIQAATAFLQESMAPSWLSAHAARPRLLQKAAQRFAAAPRDEATMAAQAEAAVAFEGAERLSSLRAAARARANSKGQTMLAAESNVTPVLVLHGSDDSVYPPDNAVRLAELCGPPCEQAFLHNCGHLPFFEEPQLFVKTVSDFIARVEAGLDS